MTEPCPSRPKSRAYQYIIDIKGDHVELSIQDKILGAGVALSLDMDEARGLAVGLNRAVSQIEADHA